MINKNKFSIKNTKKVLHKVGKQWVVVSAVLLGLAAGGAAVTTANADTTQVAAQPTAAQQVAKNANMSSANHSFGAADPINLGTPEQHQAPATGTPDVNTMMQKAANDVKGKAATKISSVKNRAKNDINTYGKFANVSHLTSFANDVKGTPAQPAYTNLVDLANNLNGNTYSNLALGTTSAPASNTVFGILSQASNAIGTLKNGNISTNDRAALGKINYEINRIEHDANNTALGADKTYTIPAGTFNVSMPSNSNISLPSSISASADSSSFNISNIQLPNTFSYSNPAITVNLPSINVQKLINNGLSFNDVTASVATSLNNVATQVSDDVTGDAEKSASSFISTNASAISSNLVSSSSVTNFVDAQANKFVKGYTTALNAVNTYKNSEDTIKRGFNKAATDYQAAYNLAANSRYHDMTVPVHITADQQKATAINNAKSKFSAVLEASPLNLTSSQASTFETAALQPKNNAVNDALQDIIENNAKLSPQDANTLLTNLDKPGESSQDAVNSVLSNKLPKLLAPMLNDLENPKNTSTTNNVNTTALDALKGIIAGKIQGTNIDGTVQSKVNGAINPLIKSMNGTIDSAIQYILSPTPGIGDMPALGNYTLSGVNNYLVNLNNRIINAKKNPEFSSYSKQLNEASSYITSVTKHLDNLQNDLSNLFDKRKPTSAAYNNLVSNVANLPNDLTATSGKSTNTEEQSAYSAYSNIASDISTLSGIAVSEARAKRGNGDADKVNDFAKLNYGEASGSAFVMNKIMTALSNASDAANDAVAYINNNSQSSFSYNGHILNYSQASDQARKDSTAISNATSAYANSLSNVSVPQAEAEAADAESINPIASSHQHNGGKVTPSHKGGNGNQSNGGNNGYIPLPSTPTNNMNYNVEPTSANTNVEPEVTPKHAANYAKVIKALQLHTNPNFTSKNAVAVVKPGSAFWIEKSVKDHTGALRYEVKYNKKNYYITANKRFVDAYYKAAKHANHSVNNYVHYRYAKVTKALQLHTNARFTGRNGVKVVNPGTEFHINNIVKDHGYVRYEVRYQGHNYFITANHAYTVNAYVQNYNYNKHGYKGVRVVKPINEYKKLNFAKRSLIRHVYRGSVLPVKKVVTIAGGEMTRLQLTNGHYVTANKDFVEPIR